VVPVRGETFVDYYELLQVSSNADDDTIHRIYRHLAKKYHPDGEGKGDAKRFNLLVQALRTLTNPETRAAYDAKYQQHWNRTWKVNAEAADGQGFVDDAGIRERLLSLLYVQRRRSMREPGMGDMELARLVGSPHEHLEFHLWYLKEKGWVQRLDTGQHAITAQGVDEVERQRVRVAPAQMIETRVPGAQGDANGGRNQGRGGPSSPNGSP
jgi:curved DNA-binding protein CbpA